MVLPWLKTGFVHHAARWSHSHHSITTRRPVGCCENAPEGMHLTASAFFPEVVPHRVYSNKTGDIREISW